MFFNNNTHFWRNDSNYSNFFPNTTHVIITNFLTVNKLFQTETTFAYHLSIHKDEEAISTSFEEFFHIAIHGDGLLLTVVFDVFLFAILHVGTLVWESALWFINTAIRLDDAGIDGALSVLGSHVLHDGEAEGEFLHVLCLVGLLTALVECLAPEARRIQLCRLIDFVFQLEILVTDVGDTCVSLIDLRLDFTVLRAQFLIGTIE